jgi:2-hydroxychromene-2-carboxylate isomerase
MTARAFAVTFDYRCPFARNAHEHLLAGLAGGADWEVTFTPLSLGQMHVEEGGTSVWDDPSLDTGLWALQAGVVVRDRHAEQFPAVHRALFEIRHDRAEKLTPDVVTATLAGILGGEAADAVAETVDAGEALLTVRKEHEAITGGPGAWGVPTFVTGDDRAVFVRLMDRNAGATAEEQAHGRATIERVLDLLEWTDLNEFKAARIPR